MEKFTDGYKIDPNVGGKAAIERLLAAYGFRTRQALCEQVGVSKSTMANRYSRDTFPADWIIQCALETGVSLKWLTTGEGSMTFDPATDIEPIDKLKLIDGKLHPANYLMIDKALLPSNLTKALILIDGDSTYFLDKEIKEVSDGLWLIEIEGRSSIKKLTRIPIGRVKITGEDVSFECSLEEVKLVARVVLTLIKN
ncbi:phage repressor protein CI [Yersinia hibernica]|uniref:Phage repressor protein n=1 Tax=Yersinia enterocolitica LC20 TaxID=1443113 RepID=A0A7U5PGW9_YEREN|nr:phage repressor protein CI [Yersinia hibernica]ATX62952.1 phage repressor protein [Yersinia hibernica]